MIKQTIHSIAQKSLIYGVGINDADYQVQPRTNKISHVCPFYSRWQDMLKRCYSKKLHKKQPTYSDCTVCNEWMLFSAFKEWMNTQDWKGKELDKDLLIKGNKVYSPSTCIFVSRQINSLTGSVSSRRGKYPRGVTFAKDKNKFRAACSYKGVNSHIGYFDNALDASNAYVKVKRLIIDAVAAEQTEPLRSALLRYEII